jgi:hypothetical protein
VAPGEISSLANFMARQKAASSAPEAQQSQAGEGTPNGAATSPQSNREQFIPRERFDEVLNERNQLRQQFQQYQQPPQQNFGQQPQFGAVPQFQPQQAFSPTGMQGQQPQAPQVQAPDFSDPKVQKEWRDKIANNPVTGLREFVSLMLQAEGGPLLEQFRQQITSQIAPIQQTFVQQQLQSYAQQRQAADPSFGQVAPTFNQLVSQAVQRGYSLTPQVLQAIEGIARAQSGMLTAPPPQAPRAPFTETPGGNGSFGESEGPSLSAQQRAVAERFGMSAQEYAQYLRSYDG